MISNKDDFLTNLAYKKKLARKCAAWVKQHTFSPFWVWTQILINKH